MEALIAQNARVLVETDNLDHTILHKAVECNPFYPLIALLLHHGPEAASMKDFQDTFPLRQLTFHWHQLAFIEKLENTLTENMKDRTY